MFTTLSEFPSLSVRAFNIHMLAHAQLLIVVNIWTTNLLSDVALPKPVSMQGHNGFTFMESKSSAMQRHCSPKVQWFCQRRAVKVMD